MVLNKDKKMRNLLSLGFPIILKKQTAKQQEPSERLDSFDNWPQYWADEKKWTGGYHSFSGNYQVEKLNNLTVKFKFRLVDFNAPLKKIAYRENG
uniref:Uncharacterized protein n=1 Tax=Chryseobacterium endophyticum TaxID=1854762 RepID=A0AAU6WQK9_9FLAO